MISRLTAFAALFAVITTASLAFATNVRQQQGVTAQPKAEIVMLERVVITGRRDALSSN